MPSLPSMEDVFYGLPEPTWILPTRGATPPRPRLYQPQPPRPVVRYEPRPPVGHDIRPIERLARVHTVPEPMPVNSAHEEIRKIVEFPVPVPAAIVAPPPQVVVKDIPPPIRRPVIHHPIELKVPMCCEKCAKKVKDRLEELEGVESVVADQYHQKVIVYGHVDPARVLNRVKLVKKKSVFWDMTVDYSQAYRRARQAQEDAARAEVIRAEASRAEAIKAEAHAKAMVAPTLSSVPNVVVKLPQEQHGPKVTAILPAERENALPYVVNSRHHSERYVSPPRAYRRELYHAPRGEMRRPAFYSDRHPNAYSVY